MKHGAHAQIEIIRATENGDKILASAVFYWDCNVDWENFVLSVTRVGDRMFAEFDAADNSVTFYTQLRTGRGSSLEANCHTKI